MVASLKPELFCGVALWSRGSSAFFASNRWSNSQASYDGCSYATINVNDCW